MAEKTEAAEAERLEIRFHPNRDYTPTLTGGQIKFLLELIASSQFAGSQAFTVVNTLNALQKPLLDEAHGAKEALDA